MKIESYLNRSERFMIKIEKNILSKKKIRKYKMKRKDFIKLETLKKEIHKVIDFNNDKNLVKLEKDILFVIFKNLNYKNIYIK